MKKTFILLIFIMLACKEKDDLQNAKPMNYKFVEDYNNKAKVDSLSKRVLVGGDTEAFRELKYIYMISEHSEEFLYISTVMAEKYHYWPAYYTNYDILKDFKHSRNMQKLAVFNLIKSYELGNKQGLPLLNKMFPKGFPKSADYLGNVDTISN